MKNPSQNKIIRYKVFNALGSIINCAVMQNWQIRWPEHEILIKHIPLWEQFPEIFYIIALLQNLPDQLEVVISL